ncbi:MAG: SlyX family protein [Phycisphaerales bacterium]
MGDGGREGDARLAARLMSLEESHTFLARSLEQLSEEIAQVGGTLRDLVRRMDRMEGRMGEWERRGDEADADGE